MEPSLPVRDADLIAVRGSPLDDIRRLKHVEIVMLAGRVMRDAATRAAEGR